MVFQIKLKSIFSIVCSKIIIKLSKSLFKGGTNFPGRVALKLDNNILSVVSNNYTIILITGTNGKTTTTSMIYNIIKETDKKVITNGTGANMFTGIVSCFIDNYSFKNSKEEKYAVIEVDEANLKFVTKYISPKIITVTNLFRDQLDRYGEVYTTLEKILEGIKLSPDSTLVLNGDESLLGDMNTANKKVYYGFGISIDDNKKIDLNADAKFCKHCKNEYSYNFITYNHLGDYFCLKCNYKRPDLKYNVNAIKNINENSSTVEINSREYCINQPGTYNIYNGLCAYSVAKELSMPEDIIVKSLKNQRSSFGRQEIINIENHEVKIILVKNPAGFDQAISTVSLDTKPLNLAFLLNDNYADGRDVSWIWDVNFEQINEFKINSLIISGIRLYDLAVRLKIAGLTPDKFTLCKEYQNLLDTIKACSEGSVYILATYTAMIDFRKFLNSKGYIKNLW